MAVSNIKASFECDIERVWRIVTSLDDYSWRSDISKIKVLSDKQFVEYTNDSYFPNFLVDKVKNEIEKVISFLETGETDLDAIQEKFDIMTNAINDLQDEFEENDSEIEIVARDSIGETVAYILEWFEIDIDVEDAIGARDW